MGNKQANENGLSLTTQEREDWIKIEDQGYCQLWANKKTDKRFQAYPISDAAAQDNVQLEKYAFRKMHSSFLVSAEAVITQNQTFLCSVPATAFVLIENIVSRLKSYPHSLTFEEGLYVLSSAASGYNTLCSFFGPLEPSEDMICFNDAGCVKVWLNENLSKNEASPSARSVDIELPKADDSNFAERRSRECVQKLLKIVELATIQGFPRGFKEETRKLSTFFEISNFVDYFCVQNKITILDHVELRRQQNVSQNQVKIINVIPVGSRVQPVPLLQSSRVKQVFQSNHHLRDGNPIFLPPVPQQQLPSYRPPVPILPPTFMQNHYQVSYIVAPALPPQAIHPPIIVNTVYSPPVQQIPQPAQVTIRTEPIGAAVDAKTVLQANSGVVESVRSEPVIIHNEPRITNTEPLSVYVEPERQAQQIISTLQQPQQVVLPAEGSLNRNQASEIQQPQFYEQDLAEHIQHKYIKQQHFEAPRHYEHEEQTQQAREEPREQQYGYNEEQPQHYMAIHEYHNQYHQHQEAEPQPLAYQHRYQQEYRPERQPNASSVYSNIERYVPPQQAPFIESLEQRREEQIISPKKQSEIDQWSQKLDTFTHSQARNQHSKQAELVVETKEPQSFKNLVVSDKRQEYVNELADLESDDIEKYIRMKYQSYLKEQAQTVTEDNQIELSSPQDVYRPKYDSYKPSQGLSEADAGYKDYYKSTSYEYKKPLVWQSSQDKNEPVEYQSYQPPILPSNNNRFSIEQDLQQQDYSSSRRNQPSSYGYRYNEEPRDSYSNQYQYPLRERDSQRRSSNRNSNIIDQKYSKYVLNSKAKRTPYNPKSEDVSLILPAEESRFIKQTPIPIVEKSFDHDSFSYNKPSAKKGITYEKLRNLLWQE